MKVIVCGAGAIGSATAYFLARRGAEVVVVERHEPAGAASGKSGGFLALDWNRGTPLDRLARRSFALHAALADELANPWLYRRLDTFMGHARGQDAATITGQIGSPETTAVVEPRLFTRGLLEAACRLGAELVTGIVERVTARGAELAGGTVLAGDAVLVALGPWSPGVQGVKGHSLVFECAALKQALFLEAEDGGEVLTPEIFPRANGTVWACAISSQPGLPVDPAGIVGDAGAHERLEALCRRLVPALADAPVVARQACFRPIAEDGLPLMGAVPGAPGVHIATGHSVWGMLNAPASGEAMAELILDGRTSHVDLARFRPERLG